jgi:hypothetical protein
LRLPINHDKRGFWFLRSQFKQRQKHGDDVPFMFYQHPVPVGSVLRFLCSINKKHQIDRGIRIDRRGHCIPK